MKHYPSLNCSPLGIEKKQALGSRNLIHNVDNLSPCPSKMSLGQSHSKAFYNDIKKNVPINLLNNLKAIDQCIDVK